MIVLELYARIFLALSFAVWGMVNITRTAYLDRMSRTIPCHERLVSSTKMQATNVHHPTIPRHVHRVGHYRQEQKTTRHPSPASVRSMRKKSITDDVLVSSPNHHMKVRDKHSPHAERWTKKKPVMKDAPDSLPRHRERQKKVPPPSLLDELYGVDDDGHFGIVHRHDKLQVLPVLRDANKFEKRRNADQPRDTFEMNVVVDDDGHFTFGHQELPSPADNPPALAHRRLEATDVDNQDINDYGGEEMKASNVQSSVFNELKNFVLLRKELPMADRHPRPAVKMTNRDETQLPRYDPQWQTNDGQSRRIFTAEPQQENDSMSLLVPTILVAVASIVIVCAAILYLCDLRDRCRYNQHWKKQRPKQQQKQRRRNVSTTFPLDMIVTPGKKSKKTPLSLSNDRILIRRSIDAEDMDPQKSVVVDWIRYMMEDNMATYPQETDTVHNLQLTSLHIPTPTEDPMETPSFDIPTPHAGPIEPMDKRVPTLNDMMTASRADRYAPTDEEEGDSQRALVSVDDNSAEVELEEKNTMSNPSPAKPQVMLSPAAANALSPTRSEISILTEGSSNEEGTDDDRTQVSTQSQQLLRRELVSDEEVDVTMTTATSKKISTLVAPRERSPDTLLEEERDASHQHLKAPNDGGDDELRIVELTDSTDENRQVEQLLSSLNYHSVCNGPRSRQGGESNRTNSPSSSDDEDFIRNIFYVPTASTDDTKELLGLQVIGASCPVTHPMVTFVGEECPLFGRVFVGDFVLQINEQEAGGMSSDDVLKLLNGAPMESRNGHVVARGSATTAASVKMIKLTVMSSHADGSDTDASVDFGLTNSAAEF